MATDTTCEFALIAGIVELNSRNSYGVTRSGLVKKKFFPLVKNILFSDKTVYVKVNPKKAFQPTNMYVIIKIESIKDDEIHGIIERWIGNVGEKEAEFNFLKEACIYFWKSNKHFKLENIGLIDLTPERKDYTDQYIVSIDPIGCKDIDDALHVQQISETNFIIGIHIADVSSYIENGSDLDIEASKRAESVYLNFCQINMLPDKLSTELISLREGEIKRAFSVIIEIEIKDKIANIISIKFEKSKIVVAKNTDYDTAQKIVDVGIGKNDSISLRMAESLTLLYNLAKIINIESYKYNESEYDMHKMVEIYMVLANHLVAKQIISKYSTKAIIREHKGIRDTSKIDFTKIDSSIVSKIKILNTNRAKYSYYSDDTKHIGLEIGAYTHFTSPIRRYVDILVHRMLFSVISDAGIDESKFHKVDHSTLEHINDQHEIYQKQQRDNDLIDNIYKIIDRGIDSFVSTAHIVGLDGDKISLYINEIDTIITTSIYSNKLSHLLDIENIENISINLVSKDKSKTINIYLGMKIEILIAITIRNKQKIKINIINPSIKDLFSIDDFIYEIL
jgi:exoribonuclease R